VCGVEVERGVWFKPKSWYIGVCRWGGNKEDGMEWRWRMVDGEICSTPCGAC
jgi:hypothetical protein